MTREEASERYRLAMDAHALLGETIRVLGLTHDQIAPGAEFRGILEAKASEFWRQFADREYAE